MASPARTPQAALMRGLARVKGEKPDGAAEQKKTMKSISHKNHPRSVNESAGVAVLAALPVFADSASAATIATTAVKGSSAAKAAASIGLAGAIIGPIAGLLGLPRIIQNSNRQASSGAFFSSPVRPLLEKSVVDSLLQPRDLHAKFLPPFMLQSLELRVIKNRRHDL